MLGRKGPEQLEMMVAGSLGDLVPSEHILARVDRVLDLSWLPDQVADCYASGRGRPGIDPEAALRLMLAGFLLGIVHDRRLMREAQVNLAIRWFAGFGLSEPLPDHSTLTRIRQRWGAERFKQVFRQTVQTCAGDGIATGEVMHVDASLIRADVSWDSLAEQHADEMLAQDGADAVPAERPQRSQSGRPKKRSRTDPDATVTRTSRRAHSEPGYKQHAVVDAQAGVIVEVDVSTGEANESNFLIERLDAVSERLRRHVVALTADAGYAYGKVFGELERRDIEPVIPPKAEPIRSPVPLRRFRYDARNDIVKCPQGRIMRPTRRAKHGRFFYSRAKDCRRCTIRQACLSKGRANKAVVIGDDYPALLRARRRRERWGRREHRLYNRHWACIEGIHGEAKSWHGLSRAVRRGLDNVRIQAFLTAAAINLKRLAAAIVQTMSLLIASLSRGAGPRRASWNAIDPLVVFSSTTPTPAALL